MILRRTVLATAAWMLAVTPFSGAVDAAGGLGAPAGRVLLTVSGDVDHPNVGDEARFDREMLEALGTVTLHTSTAWTEGVREFEGVLARDVLEAAGAEGDEVLAKALNDYLVTIETEDFIEYPVLIATHMDGKELHIRDKGPLWLVYPRDQFPELNNSMTDKKWIWQLYELHVQ